MDRHNRMLRIGAGKHNSFWFARIDLWWVGFRLEGERIKKPVEYICRTCNRTKTDVFANGCQKCTTAPLTPVCPYCLSPDMDIKDTKTIDGKHYVASYFCCVCGETSRI